MGAIPDVVRNVLNEYMSLFNNHFPNTLEGFYIHGSIALDAYVEDSSDIDFIAVTNRRLERVEAADLALIHKNISNKYKKPEMDGVYITSEDIGKLNNDGTTYPYYNNGKLTVGEYFNFNPVTWWLLKNKGITIFGPDLANRFDTPSHQLTEYVLSNMNTYWVSRTEKMMNEMGIFLKQSTEEIDFEIEWTVLGLLRQFYTLNEKGIISKLNAGEYGLLHAPKIWHAIIKEAINIRKGVSFRLIPSDKERLETSLAFSNYLIAYCNQIAI